MEEGGLYWDSYAEFLARHAEASGYDFGRAPAGNVPPPTVKFPRPLRWWSLDRPKRLAEILALRDRLQTEILALRTHRFSAPSEVWAPATQLPEPSAVSFSGSERLLAVLNKDMAMKEAA